MRSETGFTSCLRRKARREDLVAIGPVWAYIDRTTACAHRLAVRTAPSHGANRGSIPLGRTNLFRQLNVILASSLAIVCGFCTPFAMLLVNGKSHPVVGHAIVSADGMIADARGLMPQRLINEADWKLFQAALDDAAIVVLGSAGHRRHRNPGRRRLVFTSSVHKNGPDGGDALAVLYNPDGQAVSDVLATLRLGEGAIAVTGGRRVFDHFLRQYDEFLLAEVADFVLPGGTACFSDGHPRTVLAATGLTPVECTIIDQANSVTLTRWVAS
jgi:hypothetical protein